MIRRVMNQREQALLLVGLMTLGVFVARQWIYAPLNGYAERLAREAARLEEQAAGIAARVSDYAGYEKDFQEEAQRLTRREPEEQEMSGMIAVIEKTAAESGVTIIEVKPQTVSRDAVSEKFSVHVIAGHDFFSVMRFVYGLESRPDGFFIDEISMERGPGHSRTVRCVLKISRNFIVPKA